MEQPLRIGIAGLGTVGAGVVKLLTKNKALIAERAGRPIKIVAVSARRKNKMRDIKIGAYRWFDDPVLMARDPGVDVVVELIGGSSGPAYNTVKAALRAGKSVVTANKALLAHQGVALAALASKHQRTLSYEAAVAGGIPVIKALREGFAANEISAVYGILNGTCNFILTEMRKTGRDFKDVLAEAQAKGYAEADPSFDVDGIDASHKLCLLSALAFGVQPSLSSVEVQGIRHIEAADITYASEFGYRIKLLGIGRMEKGKLIQSVEPCLVPFSNALSSVESVYNAVYIKGDFSGKNVLVGRGAGEGPTASAVVADLIDIARGSNVPVFGVPVSKLKKPRIASSDIMSDRFYMRLMVKDKPGVLSSVSAVLRDHDVSVEAVIQRGRDPKNPVAIVMTTHRALQADMKRAAAAIAKLNVVHGKPCLLRIEDI